MRSRSWRLPEEGEGLRFLHPPRTGGSSLVRSWGLGRPEYQSHHLAKPGDGWRYGFTRNPWDRVVSLFHLSWRESDPHPEFCEWILSGMDADSSFGERWHRDLTLPTWAWLKDADWIGRFECREEHLLELCSILDREVPTHHIAKSHRRKPYPEYYTDPAAIEAVRERYAVDVEEFGYEFQGVAV